MKDNDEHKTLFNQVQQKYIETKDENHLQEMYLIIKKILTGYFFKYVRTKGIYLPDIEYKIEDATTNIIIQYLKHPTYFIKEIGAVCEYSKRNILYERKDKEIWEKENLITFNDNTPIYNEVKMKMRICSYPNCKALINDKERRCTKHYVKPFESAVRANEELYKSKEWRRLKKYILSRDHVCSIEGCNCEEHLEVDHIIAPRSNEELFFDAKNLQLLCGYHHKKKTLQEIRDRKSL